MVERDASPNGGPRAAQLATLAILSGARKVPEPLVIVAAGVVGVLLRGGLPT